MKKLIIFVMGLMLLMGVASAGTTLINECQYLNTADETYVINQSKISSSGTCLTINATGITVECNGSNISYSDKDVGYGISNAIGFNVTTIQNCKITQGNTTQSSSYGIYLNNTVGSEVSNCNISSTKKSLYIQSSDDNVIKNNKITTTSGQSVYFVTSSNNNFTRNTITAGTNYGVMLRETSDNNTLNHNSITATYATLFLYTASWNLFYNNTYTATATTEENIVLYEPNQGNVFINETITGGAREIDVWGANYYTTYFLNCSFTATKAYFRSGSTNKIAVQHYLDVLVQDAASTAIVGAAVTIHDITGTSIFSGTTGATGYITQQNVTEYIQDVNGKTYKTNHTVNGTFALYAPASTSWNLTTNKVITLTLGNTRTLNITHNESIINIGYNVNISFRVYSKGSNLSVLQLQHNASGEWVTDGTETLIGGKDVWSTQDIDWSSTVYLGQFISFRVLINNTGGDVATSNITSLWNGDNTKPIYSNSSQNATTARWNELVVLSAQIKDNNLTLSMVWLESNRTGAWVTLQAWKVSQVNEATFRANYTYNATGGKICWRYNFNDTSGNSNQTNVTCFTAGPYLCNTSDDTTISRIYMTVTNGTYLSFVAQGTTETLFIIKMANVLGGMNCSYGCEQCDQFNVTGANSTTCTFTGVVTPTLSEVIIIKYYKPVLPSNLPSAIGGLAITILIIIMTYTVTRED